MSAMLDYMQLCRLCLVKEKVNVPIFGDESDVRQIFLKITACLPVKVAQEDNLPKKICDACLYKVDLLYQFWNTTVNAEKQLIQWLTEIGVDVNIKNSDTQTLPILPQSHAHPHSIPVVVPELKEERPEIVEKQPEYQIPEQPNMYPSYDNLGYPQAEVTLEVGTANTFVQPEPVEDPPPPEPPAPTPKKRGRPAGVTNKKSPPKKKATPAPPPVVVSPRTNSTRRSSATAAAAAVAAAAAAATDSEEDSDGDRLGGMDYEDSDSDEDHIPKEEMDSDEDYVKPKSFLGVPSSADGEQPGPSGLGVVKGEGSGANATESGQAYNEANYMEPCSSLSDLEEHNIKPLKISVNQNLGQYPCESCNKSFFTLAELIKHKKQFHNLECEFCFEIFKSSSSLMKHLSIFHEIKNAFKCEICSLRFEKYLGLVKHKHIHKTCNEYGLKFDSREKLKIHTVPNLKCDFCNEDFKCNRLLVQHQTSNHYKDFPYSCYLCDHKFISNDRLEVHLTNKHKVSPILSNSSRKTENLTANDETKYLENKLNDSELLPFKSNSEKNIVYKSDETFAAKNSLLRLALQKSNNEIVNKPETNNATEDYLKDYILYNQNDDSCNIDDKEEYICDICGKKYKTKTVLRQHKRDHAAKGVECNLCNKTFKNSRNLQQHKKRHCGQYPFHCPDCRRGFYARTTLEEHHNVVHKGLRLKCELCNKTFGSKIALLKHKPIHNPIKNKDEIEKYPCTLCDKTYESKTVLRQHITPYKSFRPIFICDICGKILTSKGSLHNHKNAHTGTKPFTCNYCKKTFTSKSQLKCHELIHTKEKPYACKQCNKRFTQRTTLTIHLRYHSGEKPYSCNVCKKRFVTKTLMKNHAKTHGVALADIKAE